MIVDVPQQELILEPMSQLFQALVPGFISKYLHETCQKSKEKCYTHNNKRATHEKFKRREEF